MPAKGPKKGKKTRCDETTTMCEKSQDPSPITTPQQPPPDLEGGKSSVENAGITSDAASDESGANALENAATTSAVDPVSRNINDEALSAIESVGGESCMEDAAHTPDTAAELSSTHDDAVSSALGPASASAPTCKHDLVAQSLQDSKTGNTKPYTKTNPATEWIDDKGIGGEGGSGGGGRDLLADTPVDQHTGSAAYTVPVPACLPPTHLPPPPTYVPLSSQPPQSPISINTSATTPENVTEAPSQLPPRPPGGGGGGRPTREAMGVGMEEVELTAPKVDGTASADARDVMDVLMEMTPAVPDGVCVCLCACVCMDLLMDMNMISAVRACISVCVCMCAHHVYSHTRRTCSLA